MDTSLIHVQSSYIEMMKKNVLFFRSSTNDANKTPSPPLKSKEVSSLRSVSLSFGSFYDSGPGKKNFTDISKSPYGHSKKVHPKKSGHDSSKLHKRARKLVEQNVSLQREVSSFNEKEVDNRIKMSFMEKHLEDLSKRIEKVSEENQNLRQQLTQLQAEYRVAQENRDYVREKYQENVKEVKSETLLTTVLREKLYFEEMDIKQLQADLTTIVRVHQNSTCGVAKNVGTTAKPNGIMHEPVHPWLSSRTTLLLGLGMKVVLQALHLGLLYVGSVVVLLVYSILYGLTKKESNWLGATILAAVIILVTDPLAARLVEHSYPPYRRFFAENTKIVLQALLRGVAQVSNAVVVLMLVILILDLNLVLAFQEKLCDPRITSMLKWKGRHTDHELANLLQDKEIDLNFAVMLKENVLDPMILDLLQRSSLDADREYHDSNALVTNSNDVEDMLPNHILFSQELRLHGLGKWLQRCRVMLHHVAGTPE
ncbi:hypothetical protein CQW23_18521 [Capsicum baccatum]|uniref:Uncharacterized protein n=1 Tax=Capsicum baccatum TaxID=33114 RepID=A0A2G2W348_CAPBA|nr:hypothetical protein CQW23_18521 [Capsicum baccatum]